MNWQDITREEKDAWVAPVLRRGHTGPSSYRLSKPGAGSDATVSERKPNGSGTNDVPQAVFS
jgi:hypothetical protein